MPAMSGLQRSRSVPKPLYQGGINLYKLVITQQKAKNANFLPWLSACFLHKLNFQIKIDLLVFTSSKIQSWLWVQPAQLQCLAKLKARPPKPWIAKPFKTAFY